MNNRRFSWLGVLLAFVFFAAACGGETSDDSAGDTGDNASSTDSDDADDSGDDSDDSPGGPDDSPEQSSGDDAPEESDDEMTEEEADPNIYEDPRGGVFLEFQQGFDRGDHPFMQVDSFCLPHEPAADRVETDDGITADSINVGHIRSRLEDLTGIGFAVPVGDPKEMYEVFIDYINE